MLEMIIEIAKALFNYAYTSALVITPMYIIFNIFITEQNKKASTNLLKKANEILNEAKKEYA